MNEVLGEGENLGVWEGMGDWLVVGYRRIGRLCVEGFLWFYILLFRIGSYIYVLVLLIFMVVLRG